MDHDTDVTQGRPSGGGMQTRSKAASGKRPRSRAKKSTPSGFRGPRAPASAARTTPSGVTDAETIGAQGAAGAKVCTPEPISLEGLGEQDRTRRVTVSVPTAAGTGPVAADGNATNVAEDETKTPVLQAQDLLGLRRSGMG